MLGIFCIGVLRLDSNFQNLDLLELLTERHIMIKSMSEERWNELSDIPISFSEWYILSKIYKRQPTIAYVTRHLHITRQATHKLIKKLESKGLVEINQSTNRRDKLIQLTSLGESCFERQLSLKNEIEAIISNKIGESELNHLKDILRMDWGIER